MADPEESGSDTGGGSPDAEGPVVEDARDGRRADSEGASGDADADEREREDSDEAHEDSDEAHEDSDGELAATDEAADAGETREALRRRVEEKYDFENFGPADMMEMTADEWEVAFEDDAWITGEELLDRLEADLRSRVAKRDVFAVVERIGGDRPRLVAYSDEGYAIVDADGTVEGRGTVLRDVKPSIALTSMPEYDVPEPPEDAGLPAPDEVPQAGGGLGNVMLQVVAVALLVAGLALVGAAVFANLGGGTLVAVVVGLVFLVAAGFLGLVVANARLSARFRAEEYRDRLRAAGVAEGERPDFLPVDEREFED